MVAKVLCLLGICVLVLAGALLPVRIIEADYEKAQRSRKILALWNSFGGGVFLATCFNALLPAGRGKVSAGEMLHPEPAGSGTEGSVCCWSAPDTSCSSPWRFWGYRGGCGV